MTIASDVTHKWVQVSVDDTRSVDRAVVAEAQSV